MTLEEMIRVIEWRMPQDAERDEIIAALKAGQAMRKESDITIQYLTMTGQKYQNAYDDACQAWDAALEGDGK